MMAMSPACLLHALSFSEMLSTGGFGQVVDFTSGEKLREVEKSCLSLLGILRSILLSYRGVNNISYLQLYVSPSVSICA